MAPTYQEQNNSNYNDPPGEDKMMDAIREESPKISRAVTEIEMNETI